MDKVSVLFAASEVAPFAKVGGLADVAGSLPKALSKLGVDVRVVMPKYKDISKIYLDKMEYVMHFFVDIGWRHQYVGLFKYISDNVTYYFIDNSYYFCRKGLYGYFDECEQFTFFTRAFIEMLPLIKFKPDVIHLNDWQTAIAPLFLDAFYKSNDYYKNIKTIYTIHNLKYQGIFPKTVLEDVLGLGWEYFKPSGIEFYDNVNLMKAGIIYSDYVNTVSPTYAEEVLSAPLGEELNNVLAEKGERFFGILNGIDNDLFNPATDRSIYQKYDKENLSEKVKNKLGLINELGLSQDIKAPLIGIVSRLVDQKGFDLIVECLEDILKDGINLVVLGTGDGKYEEMFRNYSSKYPNRLIFLNTFNADMAQKIYAGVDMFLMPSHFEPCGLSQLISLRYGTLPIVRETGGLKDTVIPYNEYDDTGYGFTFTNYNAQDMLFAIRRAVRFYNNPSTWEKLMQRAITLDFSWNTSAREYLEYYFKASGEKNNAENENEYKRH